MEVSFKELGEMDGSLKTLREMDVSLEALRDMARWLVGEVVKSDLEVLKNMSDGNEDEAVL